MGMLIKMKRSYKIYLPLVLLIIAIGIPSRLWPQHFPDWYVTYAGDFLWSMVVYFLIANVFRLAPKIAFISALLFAYAIEVSQLFHPEWLDAIRSIKIFALILGFGFLWSDIIAYTLGITLSFIIDKWLINRLSKSG